MTINQPDNMEDEKPLDPVLEKVRRKMMRLLLISIGIMVAGLMAVLVAIVYKTKQPSTEEVAATSDLSVPSDAPAALTARLPDGFEVLSTALSQNRILFFGKDAAGNRKAYIFDIRSSSITADITISGN